MKKILKLILLFVFCLIFSSSNVSGKELTQDVITNEDKIANVVLGGDTIGLHIKTKVMIVGKYEVATRNGNIKPWDNSNIIDGDQIYSIDNNYIKSNNDLNELLKSTNKEKVSLVLIRDDELIETEINIVKNENNINTLGLYIKDHITGIGTLTFINPETKRYAALGHNVNDGLSDGSILDSSIKGIKKGTKGVPGEKYAIIGKDSIGTITNNSSVGVFGVYNNPISKNTIPLLKANDVKKGKAQIATVINGNNIEYFDIEIVEVAKQNSPDVKGIKFKIIDERLINETGGVIQGMSGSPIIQNECLVGAVSHVIVNEPTLGYGVFAEWMYSNTL